MVRSSGLTALICLMIGGTGFSLGALPDESPPETKPPVAEQLPPAGIARLIEQLDAPEFEVRERATKRLTEEGQSVIDSVTKAAASVSLEAGTRCVAVLRKLHQSTDGDTRQAAQAALQQLAESKNRSIARRATEILRPPVRTSSRTTRPLNLAVGFAALPAAQATRISSRTTNGRTEMEVTAGETKISIAHTSGKEIVIKVQGPPPAPGKDPVIKEYKARDLDELKEKHPEAHAHYERYASRVRTINVANIAAAAARPGLPVNPGPELPAEMKQALVELQAARSEMSRLYSKMLQLSRRTDLRQDELKTVLDDLKSLSDRITEVQKKLPK